MNTYKQVVLFNTSEAFSSDNRSDRVHSSHQQTIKKLLRITENSHRYSKTLFMVPRIPEAYGWQLLVQYCII